MTRGSKRKWDDFNFRMHELIPSNHKYPDICSIMQFSTFVALAGTTPTIEAKRDTVEGRTSSPGQVATRDWPIYGAHCMLQVSTFGADSELIVADIRSSANKIKGLYEHLFRSAGRSDRYARCGLDTRPRQRYPRLAFLGLCPIPCDCP